MILATITAGAFHSSQSVTVTCALANELTIVLYRGDNLIAQGTLANGAVVLAVAPLAKGDIIQASVTERGNQAGLPVLVSESADRLTGWRTPQTVKLSDTETITAAEYEARFGERPAATYNPALVVGVVAPDPETIQTTAVVVAAILFDLSVIQQVGSTTVTISNVLNQLGNALVRWASTESYGNAMSRSFTQSSTVTIEVKGENDTTPMSRTVNVPVFAPATTTPGGANDIPVSYRLFNDNNYIRVNLNSLKGCECKLDGFSANWQACAFYGTDYQEATFNPVPLGTYTAIVRVAGDADSSRWKSVVIKTN